MQFSDTFRHHTGWCPNNPPLRIVPAVRMDLLPSTITGEPDGSGPAGRSGRILLGVSIAAGSLKAMVHYRQLLIFSLLSGLVMFFLVEVETWSEGHHHYILPFLTTFSIGNSVLVFDPWIFLVEMTCLFCFTLVLADLILNRNRRDAYKMVTFRERLSGVLSHAGPLVVLSMVLALIAMVLFATIYQSRFLTGLLSEIFVIFFWPPFSYVLWEMVDRLCLAFLIMFISFIPFLLALCLVPVMVPGKKGLVPALTGSFASMQRTWREMLGCCLVYGTIVLVVAAVAFVIGQGPKMLMDNGYQLSMYLGHILMTIVYYCFISACLLLMVAVFSAAGIAIADLSRIGEPGRISGEEARTRTAR